MWIYIVYQDLHPDYNEGNLNQNDGVLRYVKNDLHQEYRIDYIGQIAINEMWFLIKDFSPVTQQGIYSEIISRFEL